MPYRLEPDRPVGEDVRRVALACIDDVRTHVDQLGTPGMDGNATETAVHETRKRCKELRGLLRLVRPALGSQYGRLNAHDRDAAKELSTLRDAQTLLDTEARHLDDLSDLLGDDHDLAVLVERLERDAHADALEGVDIEPAIALARRRQADLRSDAFDLGRRVYADKSEEFVRRLVSPWAAAIDARRRDDEHATVERERTFLVADMPEFPDVGANSR